MTINLTGTVLASILFEHSNSTCDKEGLVLGRVSNIITDTISDNSLNNVERQTVYHVHSFLHCKKLFSWYNSMGEVQTDALKEILLKHNAEDVIGWYKLRQNSSLVPSIRERSVHRHLEGWMKRQNANRKLVFFLAVSNSTYNGALYTNDHQFMIETGRKFQNMAINIVNLGSISKPNYQDVPNFTCSSDSSYLAVVNKLRSNFVNGMNELESVKKVDLMKAKLHDKLKKVCAKLIRSEAELEKEAAEVKRLRGLLQSAEGQISCEVLGNGQMNTGPVPPPQHNADLMEVEDYDKPLIVFDDDDDGDVAALRDVGRGKEHGTTGAGKSGRTSGANRSHLLDDNNEPADAIQLFSDDSVSENASTSAGRRGGKASKDTEPFEFVGDDLVAPLSSGSSSSPRRLRDQMNASPEPDLRGGVGRTARRARGPRSCKTNPDAAPVSAAYGGISERTRKKVVGRDEN